MTNPIVVLVAALIPLSAIGFSFPDNRYPAPADFERLLAAKFPSGDISCLNLDRPAVEQIIGVNDPATGEPTLREPGSAFVRWYAPCLEHIVALDFRRSINVDENMIRRGESYFSVRSLKALASARTRMTAGKVKESRFFENLELISWLSLSEKERTEIALDLISYLIGPGVLPPQVEIKVAKEILAGYAATPLSRSTTGILEVCEKLVFALTLREEFLLSPP